jgi:hypothetical protein
MRKIPLFNLIFLTTLLFGIALSGFAYCQDLTPLNYSDSDSFFYRDEMRHFIQAISRYSHQFHPNFIIVPQNGLSLLTTNGEPEGVLISEYLTAIDGVGQEELFFGFLGDDEPTPEDITSDWLSFLNKIQALGKAVLITDYCSNTFNIKNSFERNNLQHFILSLRFMPPVAVALPFFLIWMRLRLLDSMPAVIFTYLTIAISTMIWLTIECFKQVPVECEEAAHLEGCTQFQVFSRVALPLAIPSILGMCIFIFILLWNEFFLAFVITSQRAVTMPVASAAFAVVGMEVPWGQICASVILLSIPPLILSYFFVKFLPYFFKVS